MTFPTVKDFIKCGSPLGEYELHCNQEQMNLLISDHEIVERLKNHIFMRMECQEPKEPNCIICEVKKILKSILENKK